MEQIVFGSKEWQVRSGELKLKFRAAIKITDPPEAVDGQLEAVENCLKQIHDAFGPDELLVKMATSEIVNSRGWLNRTPLLETVMNKKASVKIVNWLLAHEALMLPDILGDTPLHRSAEAGHKEITDALLARPDTAINQVNCEGQTAISKAVARSKHQSGTKLADNKAIRVLKAKGADLSVKDVYGRTYYDYMKLEVDLSFQYVAEVPIPAAWLKQLKTIRFDFSDSDNDLIRMLKVSIEIDVNEGGEDFLLKPVNYLGDRICNSISLRGNPGLLKWLLTSFPTVEFDVPNVEKKGPLYWAVWGGFAETAAVLLDDGRFRASINRQGHGLLDTALHRAVLLGRADLTLLLVHSGADIAIVNHFNQNAFHLAARRGSVAVLEALAAGSIEMDTEAVKRHDDAVQAAFIAVNSDGRTPLLEAASEKNFHATLWLLSHMRAADVPEDVADTVFQLCPMLRIFESIVGTKRPPVVYLCTACSPEDVLMYFRNYYDTNAVSALFLEAIIAFYDADMASTGSTSHPIADAIRAHVERLLTIDKLKQSMEVQLLRKHLKIELPVLPDSRPAGGPPQPLDKPLVVVTAFDGGGTRGIIPSMVLEKIIERLRMRLREKDKPLHELVSISSGTSTGGIISLGVFVPKPGNTIGMEPSEIVEIYKERSITIFPPAVVPYTFGLIPRFWSGVVTTKYTNDGVRALAEAKFESKIDGEIKSAVLGDALTRVLVATYDGINCKPVFLDSKGEFSASADMLAKDATLATSAAPTYLPPHKCKMGGEDYTFLDGGVCTNNPAMLAYSAAKKAFPGHEILVVSFGTGNIHRKLTYYSYLPSGELSWATSIPNVAMDGPNSNTDVFLREMLSADRYFRFDVDLAEEIPLDASSPEQIKKMQSYAELLIEKEEVNIGRLVDIWASAVVTPGGVLRS